MKIFINLISLFIWNAMRWGRGGRERSSILLFAPLVPSVTTSGPDWNQGPRAQYELCILLYLIDSLFTGIMTFSFSSHFLMSVFIHDLSERRKQRLRYSGYWLTPQMPATAGTRPNQGVRGLEMEAQSRSCARVVGIQVKEPSPALFQSTLT